MLSSLTLVNGLVTQAHTIYGVYADGSDIGTNPNSTSYGIYATASSAAGTAWAGYFDGIVNVNGAHIIAQEVVSATATISATTRKTIADTTAITLTLPATADVVDGQIVEVVNVSYRNTAGNITLAANTSQTIMGVATDVIASGGARSYTFDASIDEWVL